MKIAARKRPSIRIRGRSFMALVLSPISPLDEWLAELDVQTQRATSFFQGRFVILDLSLLPREDPGIRMLIDDFRGRGVRLIGIEGADPSWETEMWQLPPAISLLSTGDAEGPPPVTDGPATDEPVTGDGEPAAEPIAAADPADTATTEPPKSSGIPPIVVPSPAPGSLLLDRSVRSGQTVMFDKGDVIVVGSVSSGAEIFAGGSIHIYGTLRGRAIAGMSGDGRARIFCRKFDAELLAIEGVYKTADDMEPSLRGRAVQAWLDGEEMIMAALD